MWGRCTPRALTPDPRWHDKYRWIDCLLAFFLVTSLLSSDCDLPIPLVKSDGRSPQIPLHYSEERCPPKPKLALLNQILGNILSSFCVRPPPVLLLPQCDRWQGAGAQHNNLSISSCRILRAIITSLRQSSKSHLSMEYLVDLFANNSENFENWKRLTCNLSSAVFGQQKSKRSPNRVQKRCVARPHQKTPTHRQVSVLKLFISSPLAIWSQDIW